MKMHTINVTASEMNATYIFIVLVASGIACDATIHAYSTYLSFEGRYETGAHDVPWSIKNADIALYDSGVSTVTDDFPDDVVPWTYGIRHKAGNGIHTHQFTITEEGASALAGQYLRAEFYFAGVLAEEDSKRVYCQLAYHGDRGVVLGPSTWESWGSRRTRLPPIFYPYGGVSVCQIVVPPGFIAPGATLRMLSIVNGYIYKPFAPAVPMSGPSSMHNRAPVGLRLYSVPSAYDAGTSLSPMSILVKWNQTVVVRVKKSGGTPYEIGFKGDDDMGSKFTGPVVYKTGTNADAAFSVEFVENVPEAGYQSIRIGIVDETYFADQVILVDMVGCGRKSGSDHELIYMYSCYNASAVSLCAAATFVEAQPNTVGMMRDTYSTQLIPNDAIKTGGVIYMYGRAISQTHSLVSDNAPPFASGASILLRTRYNAYPGEI